MKRILIIGATSAIAQETAKLFADQRARIYLLGRDEQRLDSIAHDLRVRGALFVDYATADFLNFESHSQVLVKAIQSLGGLDVALLAHGTLSSQKACEKSFADTYEELKINFISSVSFLTILANYFEEQQKGTLAVISSVAGDRGRQSNYVYGTAKAALNTFMQGMRHRLHAANVQVLTIKPGFVDTPMTKDFKKGFLWATPKQVAENICTAINKKRSEIYTPWFWQYIMWIIKAMPERVFNRLKL